jgi:hypothetical protein
MEKITLVMGNDGEHIEFLRAFDKVQDAKEYMRLCKALRKVNVMELNDHSINFPDIFTKDVPLYDLKKGPIQ